MTQVEPTKPPGERRRQPAEFVSVDAAILAAQAQKLDELNKNIIRLAEAIDTRPTREEIDRKHRANTLRVVAAALLTVIVVGFMGYQVIQNRAACLDRNNNTVAFRSLLLAIEEAQTEQGDYPGRDRLLAAFQKYREDVTPIDC